MEQIQEIIKKAEALKYDALFEKYGISMTGKDVLSLTGKNWLTDNVINFYMELLVEQSQSNEMPKVFAMNTNFLQKLETNGYEGVRRWTKKNDIFDHDIMLVPVHVSGNHWCMAMIHFENKTIQYYDSLGHENTPCLKVLSDYLAAEMFDKKKRNADAAEWTLENVKNLPKQQNMHDCGVFACMYAKCITRNKPLSFGQKDMENFRNMMIGEICRGNI